MESVHGAHAQALFGLCTYVIPQGKHEVVQHVALHCIALHCIALQGTNGQKHPELCYLVMLAVGIVNC